MEPAEDDEEFDLPVSRGITSPESGIERAVDARHQMIQRCYAAAGNPIDLTPSSMTLLSALTRAQAFHDGAIDALRANNPFATFTLIRAYAENAAMFTWLLDHPQDIEKFLPTARRDQRLSPGRMMRGAEKRFAGLRPIYEQLSEMAHPASRTAMSGWHAVDDDSLSVRYASSPAFKSEDDFKTACFWLVELAEATAHLWSETWQLYVGDRSRDTSSPRPEEDTPKR